MNKKLFLKKISIKSPPRTCAERRRSREGFRMGLILVLSLLLSTATFAQSNFINYQGVASDGSVLADQSITVGIALIFGASGSATSYAENHVVTTDANGVFSLQIGNGATTQGTYVNLVWGDQAAFVKTSVNGTEVGITELHAAPFALNVTKATGLEAIDEGNGIGWRIKGVDPIFYGNIGDNAVDLSTPFTTAFPNGATGSHSTAMGTHTIASGGNSTAMGTQTRALGDNSTAMGSSTTASGRNSTAMGGGTIASGRNSTAMGSGTIASEEYSTAMGRATIASSKYSTAMGRNTKAEALGSTAIGRYNIGGFKDRPGIFDGDTQWLPKDPIFEIGIGDADTNRKNALTVLKNGNVGIGTHQPKALLEVATEGGFPVPGNYTNSFSIKNNSTGNAWQFFTTSYLNIYRNGAFRGAFHATTGAYTQVSDRRNKKEIKSLNNGTLQKLLQLNPVSYLMKDQKDNKRNFGLISQEVQAVFPTLTHYIKESDILTLSYTELIPILIKGIKEQQHIIEGLQSTVGSQQSQISTQNNNFKALLQRVEVLESKTSTYKIADKN